MALGVNFLISLHDRLTFFLIFIVDVVGGENSRNKLFSTHLWRNADISAQDIVLLVVTLLVINFQ